MSIDGGVPGGSCQVLSLSVRNVLPISLDVSLGKSEVEDEDLVAGLVQTDAEVIGLDIPVDEVPVVDVLDSLDHLIDENEDALEGELPEGLVEEGFEGGSHQVHNQDIVIA